MLRNHLMAAYSHSVMIVVAVWHAFGDEIAIAVGVGFVAVGFWDIWRPGAFFVVGLVILWLALPPRAPFVVRPSAGEKAQRGSA